MELDFIDLLLKLLPFNYIDIFRLLFISFDVKI